MKKFSHYLKLGAISAIVSVTLSVVIFIIWMTAQGNTISIVGPEQDMLHIVPIIMAATLANLLGACFYYFLKKKTSSPQKIYTIITILVTVLNSIFSEMVLQPEYTLVSHVLHVIVAVSSIYFLTKRT